MELIITVDMDNAAFEDEPAVEIERILQLVGMGFYSYNVHDFKAGPWDNIRDINGNTVCKVALA